MISISMRVVSNLSELAYYSPILSGVRLVFNEKAAPGHPDMRPVLSYILQLDIFISSKITERSSLYKDMKTLQPCKNWMEI